MTPEHDESLEMAIRNTPLMKASIKRAKDILDEQNGNPDPEKPKSVVPALPEPMTPEKEEEEEEKPKDEAHA